MTGQRLTVVDEMFLRSHHGYGTPVVMQGLWRGADVDAADVDRVHDALRHGILSRTVVRPRVPGARPRWQPGTAAWPVEWAPAPIPRDGVVAWADEVATRPVDPESGAGWRLAAARIDGGAAVLSLLCSHVVTDARGLATVLAAAMSGQAPAVPSAGPAHPVRADLADAARMLTAVGARTARAVAGLALHPSRRAELRSAPVREFGRPDDRTRAQVPEALIVDVDAAQWDTVAARTGGTPNSLLVAVAVAIAAGDDAPRQVSVPVDRRTDTRSASNAVDMAEVTVRRGDSPATVRALLRDAYARPPMSSPAGFPPELLQVVPDRVAYRLAPDPGERDVLCSNIGAVPATVGRLGDARADAIATRAVHPGITAQQLASSRNRLSAYLCRLGDRYTLSLVSKDPGLRARTDAALSPLDVPARHW
ncbi:hypothetical protein ACFYVR_12360 [Rhodococcus sp. NPDC003318]|uniref:hypothetical protein n=1 Tax=Rhodococcus sp. NPDC003318 TaxID=3364503 RepID=UPI0036B3D414